MSKKSWHIGLCALASVLLLAACSALRGGYAIPDKHPEELGKGDPVCTDCHEAGNENFAFADYVHGADWLRSHRQRAYGSNERVCAMCHPQSFCNECHVTRTEMKPSVFREGDTYRQMQHRGDYISRHRIDARIDPTSCFRCHGNPKSSKACVACHGK